MISIISFIFLFLIVTLTHELGHFVAARLSGIRVHELAIGIGPNLYSFKKNNTKYSINLFPIAGYVRIAGISSDDPDDLNCPDSEKYINKTVPLKFFSIFMGAFCNLAFAFILFVLIFSLYGMPFGTSSEVELVSPGSPAEAAKLLPGDIIFSVDDVSAVSINTMVSYIHENPGKRLMVVFIRDNIYHRTIATPRFDKDLKVGLLGLRFKPLIRRLNFIGCLSASISQVYAISINILYSIFLLITGRLSIFNLAGPVGIAKISGTYASSGLYHFLYFLGFFSVNVGVLNLLPIPALDGGRLAFIVLEFFRRKTIDLKIENKIHSYGMLFLLFFIFVLTLNDIFRIVLFR